MSSAERTLRALVLAGCLAVALAVLAAAMVYLRANGLTGGGLSLVSLATLVVAVGVAVRSTRARRAALVVAAVALAQGLGWAGWRLARSSPPQRLEVCRERECGRGPWWARVPPEHEAARAGLGLSGLAGFMRGAEYATFDRLLDAEYGRLGPEWDGLANALLLRSSPRAVWYHRWIPPGDGKRPVLVFLHGFGGQLTPYLRAIVESELGRDYIVLAPELDSVGRWWSADGEAVVTRLVRELLPPQADPSRVFLVGLSNGGIGATRLATEPRTRALFRGAVLVSGIGEPGEAAKGTLILVVSGDGDPRFQARWVDEYSAELERAGAEVTRARYPADHFLILTHANAWTRLAHGWLGRFGANPSP